MGAEEAVIGASSELSVCLGAEKEVETGRGAPWQEDQPHQTVESAAKQDKYKSSAIKNVPNKQSSSSQYEHYNESSE